MARGKDGIAKAMGLLAKDLVVRQQRHGGEREDKACRYVAKWVLPFGSRAVYLLYITSELITSLLTDGGGHNNAYHDDNNEFRRYLILQQATQAMEIQKASIRTKATQATIGNPRNGSTRLAPQSR